MLKARLELIEDRNQLSTTLKKVKKPEVFDHLVRSLNDMPTMESKSRLLSVLSLVPQQSLVFAMNLCKVQDKLFAEISEGALGQGSLDQESLSLLVQVAGLIQTQHLQAMARGEAVGELMVSLIIPFIQYVGEKQDLIVKEISNSPRQQECINELKNAVVSLFKLNILQHGCLMDQDEQVICDIFRLYLQLQSGLLKSSQERLKSLFIELANDRVFTGAHLALVLRKTV